jgi:hypothetical protein
MVSAPTGSTQRQADMRHSLLMVSVAKKKEDRIALVYTDGERSYLFGEGCGG